MAIAIQCCIEALFMGFDLSDCSDFLSIGHTHETSWTGAEGGPPLVVLEDSSAKA